jgi:hypothetical protein
MENTFSVTELDKDKDLSALNARFEIECARAQTDRANMKTLLARAASFKGEAVSPEIAANIARAMLAMFAR